MSNFLKMLRTPARESEEITLPEEGIVPQEQEMDNQVKDQIAEAEADGESQISKDASASDPDESASPVETATPESTEQEPEAPTETQEAPAQDTDPLSIEVADSQAQVTSEVEAEQQEEKARAIITLEEMVSAVDKSTALEYNKASEAVLINQLRRAGAEPDVKGRSAVLACAKEHIASFKRQAKRKKLHASKEGIGDFIRSLFSSKGSSKKRDVEAEIAAFDQVAVAAKLKQIKVSKDPSHVDDFGYVHYVKSTYEYEGVLLTEANVDISQDEYANASEIIGNENFKASVVLAFMKDAAEAKKKALALYKKAAAKFSSEEDTHGFMFDHPVTEFMAGNYRFSFGKGKGNSESDSGFNVLAEPGLEENRLTSTVHLLAPNEIKSFYDGLLKLAKEYEAIASPWSADEANDDGENDYAYSLAYDMTQAFNGEYLGYGVNKVVKTGIDLILDSLEIYKYILKD